MPLNLLAAIGRISPMPLPEAVAMALAFASDADWSCARMGR